MPWIHLQLTGTPAPGGSKDAKAIRLGKDGRRDPAKLARYPKCCQACGFTGVVTVRDAAGKGNKLWRAACEMQARSQLVALKRQHPDVFPLAQVCAVDVLLVMPRPKSHRRANGELRDSASDYHENVPDATKLWRSTEDALTGIVWADDKRIIDQQVTKTWDDRADAGAYLTVYWGDEVADRVASALAAHGISDPLPLFGADQ